MARLTDAFMVYLEIMTKKHVSTLSSKKCQRFSAATLAKQHFHLVSPQEFLIAYRESSIIVFRVKGEFPQRRKVTLPKIIIIL